MNELMLVEKIEKPAIPKDWDFEKANKDFDKMIYGWRRLTIDTVSQLWIFYKKLKVGHRKKRSENSEQLPSWLNWIESKGISDKTPLDHFKKLGWLPGAHVSNNSGNNEWNTPPEIIEAAQEVMEYIELDPATNKTANETVKARRIYTADDNGLSKKWTGRVWMNPPYASDLIESFIDKFLEHYKAGDIEEGIILVNNATDTKWFQKMFEHVSAICFHAGRIRFVNESGATGAPLQGQAICYFGKRPERFGKQFNKLGGVLYA